VERRRQQRLRTEALWALAQVLCDVLGEPETEEEET
jgi:hypothetical protein